MYVFLMPGLTLQTARFRNNTRPIIWLDVERRKADIEPALTSVHWGDALTTYVHDPILAESAKFTEGVLAPLNWTGDREGVRWADKAVTMPKGFKEYMLPILTGKL